MAASQRFNVLIATEYQDKDDETKTRTQFSQVGVAFPSKNDSMSVVITEGISVTGRLIICKPKPKNDSDNGNGTD